MTSRRTLLLGLAAVGLGACGGKASSEGPPKILYGEDICDTCRMAINDERHAGSIVRGDEKRRFDDAGELVAAAQGQPDADFKVWVHDFETKEWIDGTLAVFAWMPDRLTPMGTGIVAFSDAARAGTFAVDRGGWTKSWAEMLSDWTLS